MRNHLQVTFNLEHLSCYDEADGWGDAEPYMWTVYFMIDGTTCRLNDALKLEGTATIFTTPGSHGDLNNTDVDAGDSVPVPAAIGLQTMTMAPIPVPQAVKNAGIDDVPAVAGCIVILMEEDNVTDDGAEAGHQALNQAVQNALNSLIPTLGISHQDVTDADIDALTQQIESKISDAIENEQNFFENIWSWFNKDDHIGTKVWKFNGDQLLQTNPTELRQRWTGSDGDWELFGSVSTVEIPTCPADVVRAILDALFGHQASHNMTMDAMYSFRDKEMEEMPGLHHWWNLVSRNSHFLWQGHQHKEFNESIVTLFKDLPSIFVAIDAPMSDHYFDHVMTIVKHISEMNEKHAGSKEDMKNLTAILQHLRGKTPREMMEVLARVHPEHATHSKGK